MKRRWLILMAVLTGIGLAGCYTMFSHPNVGTGVPVHGEGQYCSDCHTGQDFYSYSYPYYYDTYWRYPRWWSYYCSPWWWYDYWCCDDGNSGTQLPVSKGQYWDTRERPTDRPVVPSGGSVGSGGGSSTPSSDNGKTSTRAKSSNENTTSEKTTNNQTNTYWSRTRRPPRPPKQPEEPKKADKKSEEKKTKERQ